MEQFLKEVIAGKKKQLMSIELDMGYWGLILEDKDEEQLRDKLMVERTRKSKERSTNLLNSLSQQIGEVEKAQDEVRKLVQMKGSIQQYLNYIANLSDDKKKELEEIIK